MAKLIGRNIQHIVCECGHETPIWSLGTTEQCNCRRNYKIDGMGEIEYLGYNCWDCEDNVDKLYGEDQCCADCLDNAVSWWEKKIKEGKES